MTDIILPDGWADSFEIDPTGLSWTIPEPSKNHLLAVANQLVGMYSSMQWSWADLLIKAIDIDGNEPGPCYALIAGQHPNRPAEHTLQNYVSTARRWAKDRRRFGSGAYFSHHEALNPLTDQQQDQLLDESQEYDWSASKLREIRYKRFPDNGRTNIPQPVEDQLLEEQKRSDQLESQLYETEQVKRELAERVKTMESTIQHLNGNGRHYTGAIEVIGTLQHIRDISGLINQKMIGLLPEPGGSHYLVYLIEPGQLLAINRETGEIRSYPKDDPAGHWIRVRFVEQPSKSDKERFLIQ
jgi:hypothetical protein